jgi:hypothetical protein
VAALAVKISHQKNNTIEVQIPTKGENDYDDTDQ